MNQQIPLTGLILCGGKSSRLGFDKLTVIKDHLPIYAWWSNILKEYCSNIYISCNQTQAEKYRLSNTLIDVESNQGPLGGIYSAILKHPDHGLLVVACDLVYITEEDIEALITQRDPILYSTAYLTSGTDLPFPLCTIYEPKIFDDLKYEYLYSNKSAISVLKNNDIKLIRHKINLDGINTPDEYEKWKKEVKITKIV